MNSCHRKSDKMELTQDTSANVRITGRSVELAQSQAASAINTQHDEASPNSQFSDCTSASSTPSSAAQYSDDIRRNPAALPLMARHDSGSSSTKTCEVDLGDDERDTFSPISSSTTSSSNSSPGDNANVCNGDVTVEVVNIAAATSLTVDNKAYDGSVLPSSTHAAHGKHKALTNGHGAASAGNGGNALPSTSKAEKQRQNEEIVIMETSSVSSETGSWESVFPQTSTTAQQATPTQQAAEKGGVPNEFLCQAELHNCCREFLQHERKSTNNVLLDRQKALLNPSERTESKYAEERQLYSLKELDLPPFLRERTYSGGAAVTADTSSLFNNSSTSSLVRDLKQESALNTSGTSACFIDASSLRDEDELLSFPSLDGHLSHDNETDLNAITVLDADAIAAPIAEGAHISEEESPTKQLEAFHKSFAKCKTKSKDIPNEITTFPPMHHKSSRSTSLSSNSNSDVESPKKALSVASATSTNNLSDEEKLWKREHSTPHGPTNYDAKQQQQLDHHADRQHMSSAQEDATEASVSLAIDIDSSESSYMSKVQRIPERKQDSFGMQPNVVHFSVHPLGVSPKFAAHCAAATHSNVVHSDLSYTTDYSSSSPGPSLVWSEHEQRPTDSADGVGGSNGNACSGPGGNSGMHLHKTCHLPDTPHNSIVHMDHASSNNSSIHRDCTLSSSLSHQRDSGAYCSDATESPILIPRTPKRSKFDESNPIVSGGASIKDFNIKQCESPPVRRRTENCPIVSGGFVSLDFEATRPLDDEGVDHKVELRNKPKSRKPLPGIASWVVDMSDCQPERRKSTSSTSSLEATTGRYQRERSDSTSSHKSGCGFYVTLDDLDQMPKKKAQLSKSYTAPKSSGLSCGMSHSDYDTMMDDQAEDTEPVAPADKKNIFSMFIDIGEKKVRTSARKERNTSASPSHSVPRRTDDIMKSSASSTETLMWKSSRGMPECEENNTCLTGESKSLDYRCNLDTPMTVAAIRRISQQQKAQNESAKRHSWGTSQTKDGVSHDYKRSISLTANSGGGEPKDSGNSGLMSIIDKLPLISKASSLSVDSSLSPYDEYTGSKSGHSSRSNNSARNSMSGAEREDDVPTGAGARVKKHRRDVQINETFDKSSLASITDGVLSKDLSPASTTDTDDLTFQQDEELAQREVVLQQHQHSQPAVPPVQIISSRTSAVIMETIIEAKETSSPKKNALGQTLETLHATIEKQQKMLLETVNENSEQQQQQHAEKATFVKLSDMDKPVKYDLNSPEGMSKSVGNHRQLNRLFRDENKTRPHSWTMTRSTGNSFLNITNSVDNLRSLSRLFPNFSKEFSISVPNDMVLDHQMEYVQTDLSGDSSLASSFSRSGMDESSISCRQPRRLGEDLLKMFLQEIATDMIVEVHGRRIKAHKCILRSRCQYFAAMLAGNNAQSVVSLQGYSFTTVHFALCHIYSGASHPPEGISLMELAALADLLGLEGLKEVTSHALKTNYCHNFHKPCSGCIDGILQVLPVALNHALDDLYRKCLRWTCRHYLKVWPTRQFAQLPSDILGRCRQQIIAYLTSESVLDTVLDCDSLLAHLASYRWGGICENLVRDILDAAYGYIADHFASLIASDSFLSLGHDRSCHIPRLESILLRTAANLTPDQACRSYQRITRLNTVLQAKIIQMPSNLGELAKELQGLQEEELDWDTEYIRLVSALLSAIEQCLIRQCSRAMRVTAWQRMDLDLRKKIQTLGRLTEPLDVKRNNSKAVGKAFSFGGSTRNQDLYQVKLAIQAHSKRTSAQDQVQAYKSTQTQEAGNVQTADRGVQANQDFKEGTSKVLKSNSRAHVPLSTYRDTSQSAISSERHSMNVTAHRRTQSEVPMPTQSTTKTQPQNQKVSTEALKATDSNKPKAAGPKLGEIRSRYLEPRKAPRSSMINGPIRSATTSGIPSCANKAMKGKQISSSDSSRNSSPAARKPLSNHHKLDAKASNISLDSLASPSRRCRSATRARHTTGDAGNEQRHSDVNNESMAESMRSSIITNKTISQESLASGSKLTRSNPQMTTGTKKIMPNMLATPDGYKSSKSEPKTAKSKSFGSKAHRQVQHNSKLSNGSSPSSVTTNKSGTSRLSSVSSTHSSRDMFKHRSISVPVAQDAQQTGSQRYSFLSAKSREILAKRAEKNKQQQMQQQQQTTQQKPAQMEVKQYQPAPPAHVKLGAQRSASHSAVATIAQLHQQQQFHHQQQQRSIPPSNIPTRRPNSLNLKNRTTPAGTTITHNYKQTQQTNHISANNQKNKYGNTTIHTNGNVLVVKAAAAVKQKIDLLIDMDMQQTQPLHQQQHNEHKDDQQALTKDRVESKLERSSTFCKDSADLDMNELQIIE